MPRSGSGRSGSGSAPRAPRRFSAPTSGSNFPSVGVSTGTGPSGQFDKVGKTSLDITSPDNLARTFGEDLMSTGSAADGLRAALFGVNNQGGVPIISDIAHVAGNVSNALFNKQTGFFPEKNLIGDVPRVAAHVFGQVTGAIGTAGGEILQRTGSPVTTKEFEEQWKNLPDSPEKQAIEKQAREDTGPFNKVNQLKFDLMNRTLEEQRAAGLRDPSLFPEISDRVSAPTFAAALGQLVGMLGLTSRVQARASSSSRHSTEGKYPDRMEEIDAAMAAGGMYEPIGQDKALPVRDIEQVAWRRWKSGVWTKDQALDFLSASGAGFSHDPTKEIIAELLTDPTVSLAGGAVVASSISKGAIAAARAAKVAAEVGAMTGTVARAERVSLIAKNLTNIEKVVKGAAPTGVKVTKKEGEYILGTAIGAAREAKSELHLLANKDWELIRAAVPKLQHVPLEEFKAAVIDAVDKGTHTPYVKFLTKLNQSEAYSEGMVKLGNMLWGPMERGAFGRAAKITRYIIDPLHAIGGGPRTTAAKQVDVSAEATTMVFAEAHGPKPFADFLRDMADIGEYESAVDGIATYSGNIAAKEFIGFHVAGTFAGAASHAAIRELRNVKLGDLRELLFKSQPKDWPDLVKKGFVKVRESFFDEMGDAMLAKRLAFVHPKKTEKQWAAIIAKRSRDWKSVAHAETFGKMVEVFQTARQQAIEAVGVAEAKKLKLDKLFLMNRQTLTIEGAGGILDRLAAAGTDVEAALAEMRAAQDLYPQLKSVVFDPANVTASIERFRNVVRRAMEQQALPRQIVDREIAKWPEALRNLQQEIEPIFTFGIRPEEDKLMGLIYDRSGELIGHFPPWVEPIAAVPGGFKPTLSMALNVAGQPILGRPIGKVLDYGQAAMRVMKARISTEVVVASAGTRFVANIQERFPGISEAEARKMFTNIIEEAGVHEVAPRGLSEKNMWKAVQDLIPDSVKVRMGQQAHRELMISLLDAFEGDLRFVGLTQKLTGKAKTMLGAATGTNFMGQLAEDAYQKIKFRYNPLFQLQERIEPIVLNGQRGITVAFGTRTTAEDRRILAQMRRLRDSGVLAAADVEMAKYSQMAQWGQRLHEGITRVTEGGGIRRQIFDIATAKRLNESRAYGDNMGRVFRESAEAKQKGMWLDIVAWFEGNEGRKLTDGEVASRIMSANLASDFTLPGFVHSLDQVLPPFERVIQMSDMWMPGNMGQLRALRLQDMVDMLGLTHKGNDRLITSVDKLYEAIENSNVSGVSIERVKEALFQHGAHADYVRRVERALQFNYDSFWRNIGEKFRLQPEDLSAYREIFNELAAQRNMTPVDYLSGVFDPFQTGEATVGNMGDMLAVLRPPKGKPGTLSQFVDQMSDIFAAHLDPSAREVLFGEYAANLVPPGLSGKWDLPAIEKEFPLTEPPYKTAYSNDRTGKPTWIQIDGPVDKELRAAPDDVQEEVFGIVGPARRQLPLLRLQSVGIRNLGDSGAAAVTISMGSRNITILGDAKAWGAPADRVVYWERRSMANAKSQWEIPTDKARHPNWENGVPFTFDTTPETDFWHELMHAVMRTIEQQIDEEAELIRQARLAGKPLPKISNAYLIRDFMYDYASKRTGRWVSGYSVDMGKGANVMAMESFAELGTLALSPEGQRRFTQALKTGILHEGVPMPRMEIQKIVNNNGKWGSRQLTPEEVKTMVDTGMSPPVPLTKELEDAVWDFRQLMQDQGHWVPLASTAAPAGNIIDPDAFKKAIFSRVVEGNKAPLPPDFERGVREYTKWLKTVLGSGLKNDPDSVKLLARLKVLPTEGGVPYNETHRLLVDTLAHNMRRAADDAHRLHYFARNRSWIERSINHPFLGLYPASYMYGKILPELVRFIAKEPFGIRTGVAASSFTHVMQSLATQRELDPELDALIEKLGKNGLLWFLGFLLPAVPMDVGASLPSYMRNFARQGLENQRRADAGLPPNPINFAGPVNDIAGYTSLARPLVQTSRALGEVGKLMGINQPYKPPASPETPAATGAVGQLEAPLEDATSTLRDLFSRNPN